MADENRNFSRLDLTKLAFAKEGDRAHGGLIKNLSTSGAFIEFTYPLGDVEHDFQAGNKIELFLEDETVLFGHVVRAESAGIAIHFDPENAEQQEFLQALVEAEWELSEATGGQPAG